MLHIFKVTVPGVAKQETLLYSTKHHGFTTTPKPTNLSFMKSLEHPTQSQQISRSKTTHTICYTLSKLLPLALLGSRPSSTQLSTTASQLLQMPRVLALWKANKKRPQPTNFQSYMMCMLGVLDKIRIRFQRMGDLLSFHQSQGFPKVFSPHTM